MRVRDADGRLVSIGCDADECAESFVPGDDVSGWVVTGISDGGYTLFHDQNRYYCPNHARQAEVAP